eukprot:gene5995-46871_t
MPPPLVAMQLPPLVRNKTDHCKSVVGIEGNESQVSCEAPYEMTSGTCVAK